MDFCSFSFSKGEVEGKCLRCWMSTKWRVRRNEKETHSTGKCLQMLNGYIYGRNFIWKTCKQWYKMKSKTPTPLECQICEETPRGHLKWKRIYKFIVCLECLVIAALRRNLLQYIPVLYADCGATFISIWFIYLFIYWFISK